jgi:hypothetical protein
VIVRREGLLASRASPKAARWALGSLVAHPVEMVGDALSGDRGPVPCIRPGVLLFLRRGLWPGGGQALSDLGEGQGEGEFGSGVPDTPFTERAT